MKVSFTRAARPLDQRGIAHLLFMVLMVVGVAVVGVYLGVANRGEADAAKNKAKVKSGYIVLYSQRGKYSQSKIITTKQTDKAAKCKGVTGDGIKKLGNSPKKIKCTAINNLGSYSVSFRKDANSQWEAARGVDVDAGYCVMIHPNPAKDNKVASSDGNCKLDNDTIEKQAVSLRPLPQVSKNKKFIVSFVDVKIADGSPASRAQCVGAVTVVYAGDTVHSISRPIKYTETNGQKYCVAKLKTRVKGGLSAGKVYDMKVSFPGNIWFNAAEASTQFTVPS